MTRGGQVAVEFVDYGNDQIYPKDKWQQHSRHPLECWRLTPVMCIRMIDEKLLEPGKAIFEYFLTDFGLLHTV